MHNQEIAWAFREIAALLEVKGEDGFRAAAYRKGADSLEALDRPVTEIQDGVPGLGSGLTGAIGEASATGRIQLLEELRRQIPLGIQQALALPGVGTKTAHRLLKHLKVSTLEELEKAALAKEIRNIPGLGPKIELNIARGIARLRENQGKVLLSEARLLAAGVLEVLRKLGVTKGAVSGEVRRGLEMVSVISLVVTTGPKGHQELLQVLSKYPLLTGELEARQEAGQETGQEAGQETGQEAGQGASKEAGQKDGQEAGRLVLAGRFKAGPELKVYVVLADRFAFAQFELTGSREHFRLLQQAAEENDLSLSDASEEADIYQALGLQYIVPELRENQGEIQAALNKTLPELIERSHLKGDLHLHSRWSDGMNEIGELVEAGRQLGYQYIAITDHSRSLAIARGLPEEKLLQQSREIKELNRDLEDFRVFSGIEVDILADGSLDYSDEVLAELDLVVASIHSGFRQEEAKLTKRIISAIKNPNVDIVAHPTGRVLGRRGPYPVDMEAVLAAAAKYDTALELNATPDRLDLNAQYCRAAKEQGVKLAINTDAHDKAAMEFIDLGVITARRGWLEPENVINTWDRAKLERFLHS